MLLWNGTKFVKCPKTFRRKEKELPKNQQLQCEKFLAQELTSVVEVQHNFLDVILNLLIHSFIPPEK